MLSNYGTPSSVQCKGLATNKIQASGSVFQEMRAEHHIDHTLCINILQTPWNERTKNSRHFFTAVFQHETRSAFLYVRSELGGWLGNETDGQHRLLTLACSWSRSWFLIKLIIYQKTPSCFFGGGRGQAVQPWLPQHLTAWKNGVMECVEMTKH